MRAVLMLLVVVVLIGIALVWLGVIDVSQVRQAQAPTINPGTTPAYQVDVNPPRVGTMTTNVQVPVVEMKTKQIEVPAIQTPAPAGNSQ